MSRSVIYIQLSKASVRYVVLIILITALSLIEISRIEAVENQSSHLQSENILVASTTPIVSASPAPAKILHNADWKPVEKDFNGVPMMQVPTGCFMMGSTPDEIAALNKQYNTDYFNAEGPQTRVCFDAPFWIDKTEVTNAQFKQFNGQSQNQSYWSEALRPREQITWIEAHDFCKLRVARLPTEAEWEYAARGPDGLTYPWGNTFSDDNIVDGNNATNQTATVGSKPAGASWIGSLDLSGNVWEWTSSMYKPYPYVATDGRESDADTSVNRVLRGGSWMNIYTNYLRSQTRASGVSQNWYAGFGFRCAI